MIVADVLQIVEICAMPDKGDRIRNMAQTPKRMNSMSIYLLRGMADPQKLI